MTATEINEEEARAMDAARADAEYDDKMAKAVAVVKDCAYEATRSAQAATAAYQAWEDADAGAREAWTAFDEAKKALTGVVNNPPVRRGSKS